MSTPSPPPKITCPHCQAAIKAPALPAGSRVTCPKCGQAFAIGQPVVAKPAVPAPKQPAAAPANPQSSIPTPKSPSSPPQPAPRPPPLPPTVDPLQLGPVARPKAAPPTELTVVCKLCGTRMYAPLTKAGQTMPCPDCHTVNEIAAPKVAAKKPAGPTLEGAEEFGMSELVERPKYRPTIAARGDYAELAEFEPGAHPPGWSPPQPGQTPAAVAAEEGDEFTLEAPVERVELKEPIKLPPPDPAERESSLYDGKYNDDLIGENVDPRLPDAWKRSPFVLRIIEFLFYSSTLPRWVFYSVGLAALVNVGHFAYRTAMNQGAVQMLAIPMFMALILGAASVLLPLAAALLAVINDTANGMDEVSTWPDWNPFEWLVQATFLPAAALVAGLPGFLVSGALLGIGLDPVMGAFAATVPVVASWTALLPIVLFSMLAENSIMGIVSPHTLRSFRTVGEAWMLFYLYSFVLGLFAALGASLLGLGGLIVSSLGAVLVVTTALLYCRLLGRLMWYSAEKEARLPQPAPPSP